MSIMTPTDAARRERVLAYYSILVTATFLMASGFIAGKILLADGAPPFLLVGWRFILAAAAAAPVVFFTTDDFRRALLPKLALSQWMTIVMIGVLQTTLAMGLLFWAMETIAPATAAILLFTNPLWVALIGHAVLGERLTGYRMMGLILGIGGAGLALGAGFSLTPGALGGEALGLGAAFAWTMSTIVNKRARLPIGNWTLTFWQMFFGALALLAVAFLRGETWPRQLPIEAWGWFLWLAIPGSAGSFGLWFLALARGGATRSSSYLFLVPLFTVILAALVLNAAATPAQGFGGALVGLGLWLVNRPQGVSRETGF
jgi:drug/metabolite transporter (DMT)-like permease